MRNVELKVIRKIFVVQNFKITEIRTNSKINTIYLKKKIDKNENDGNKKNHVNFVGFSMQMKLKFKN